ncbi:MAG: PQQ-binding-like beta-propeller repeat protein [Planctomycetota bacterium]|nr:PQQ-binding-like beta-propeller repeat protein [Planctomycetota bacterium]
MHLIRTAVAVVSAFALCATNVHALEVNISLVTEKDGERIPLSEIHELRRSPYGGWVATFFPFGMNVSGTRIFEYEDSLLEAALESFDILDIEQEKAAEELEDIPEFADGPKIVPGLKRDSVATIALADGEHLIQPGDLRFTIEKGKLASADPRVQIKEEETIEVLCHPVTLRGFDGRRSQPFAAAMAYDNINIMGNLFKPLEDPEQRKLRIREARGPRMFRRLRVYLPPSQGKSYRLNRTRVMLDSKGVVKLSAGKYEVHRNEVRIPVSPPPPVQLVGVVWLGDDASLSGPDAIAVSNASGASLLRLPVSRKLRSYDLTFAVKGRRTTRMVKLPNTFDSIPFKTVVCDTRGREPRLWLFQMKSLTVTAGERPGLLSLQPLLIEMKGKVTGWEARPLTAMESHVDVASTEALPNEPGTWSIAPANGELKGVPLGLLRVTGPQSPVSVVSIYTYRNRGGYRRGDPVDLFWTLRSAGQMPAKLDLVLEGNGTNRNIASDEPAEASSRLGPGHTGMKRLDTSSLAPGSYTVRLKQTGIASYPATFHIYPREQKTDFEIYSQAPFSEIELYGGNPLSAYYAQGVGAGKPGLAPFTDQAFGNLPANFGVYSTSPVGPALEKCLPPGPDEVGLMALARLGKRAVPVMPSMLHHEEWNPKHTLPNELRRLRRRNALFAQKYADMGAFGGIRMNWYATVGGYWEESDRLDGHQGRRNAAANKWVGEQVTAAVEQAKKEGAKEETVKMIQRHAGYEARSSILPNAYRQYMADVKQIRPGATFHTGIPDFWLGNGQSYPPRAYASLTHRDAVDYTDYGRAPWGDFRAPVFLNMGNPNGQKTQVGFMAHGRHARFIIAFGTAGRGIDGFAVNSDGELLTHDHKALLEIFERFGSYFTSLEPLQDVAVYFSKTSPWAHQKSVILIDLARLRRPGVFLTQEEVLADKLKNYRVLFLAAIGNEPDEIKAAFKKFEADGGYIVKDKYCAEWVPGKPLGFPYDGKQVPGRAWGLGGPNGEWEFSYIWGKFLSDREERLNKAFADAPASPVSTSDKEVLIAPLAGKETICCFVINKTYIPLSVGGKQRQHAALPRKADLIVRNGWHVYDMLKGQPIPDSADVPDENGTFRVPLDFTRSEGNLFWLTKRKPARMGVAISGLGAPRQDSIALNAWLEEENGDAILDPLPFAVRMKDTSGRILFEKNASLAKGEKHSIATPALRMRDALKLEITSLITGHVFKTEFQTEMAKESDPPRNGELLSSEDIIAPEHITTFLTKRKNRVIVLLDEGQDNYRKAAEEMVAVLKKNGRDARLMEIDPADVRELPLRWKPLEEDTKLLKEVHEGKAIAWRVDLAPYFKKGEENPFDRPTRGYPEYGPRTMIDGDVELFGSAEDNSCLKDLDEYLRRRVSPSYPSPGRYFLHYVWSPFLGGCNGIYVGCRDAAGAEAAVASLSRKIGLQPVVSKKELSRSASATKLSRSASTTKLPDLIEGKVGSKVIDFAWSPSGKNIFLTLDSYGDSFFVLDSKGEIQKSQPIGNRCGNSVWWRNNGTIRVVSDSQLYFNLWNNEYLFDIKKGFIHRVSKPHHGLPGRIKVKAGGEMLLRDDKTGRIYLGGLQKIHALDKEGEQIWMHDDSVLRTSTDHLLYRRSLFLRGLSPNGKRLLATGFGIEQDVYGIGNMRNNSVFCIDTTSGKILWEKNGLILNEGKAIVSDNRVVIVDDDGKFHLLDANTGRSVGEFRAVSGTDYLVPVPGSEYLIVVENNQFDMGGPSCKTYMRASGNRPDIVLDVAGRVTDLRLSPDSKSIAITADRGTTALFNLKGEQLWRVRTSTGGPVRFSPDGARVGVGTRAGQFFMVESASGKVINKLDLNRFNLTTPEQYVEQMSNIGGVPILATARAPEPKPEPSYLKTLNKEAIEFGENLLPLAKLRKHMLKHVSAADDLSRSGELSVLNGTATYDLAIKADSTYLVEFLNGGFSPEKPDATARLEVSIISRFKSKHLPFVARLAVGQRLVRRRFSFRADKSGTVQIRFRLISPKVTGEGRRARASYAEPVENPAPIFIGEVVLASMKFQSRNVLFSHNQGSIDTIGGPEARGEVKCSIKPWRGGNSTVRWQPWDAPRASLRLVDGLLGNQETKWQESREVNSGSGVHSANAMVKFKKPQPLNTIAIYEDNRGPVPSGASAKEMTAQHYGVYIHEVETSKWRRVGYVHNNTNLVNIFTFPSTDVDQIHYFWAGRPFVGRTDGMVRMAEFEAYVSEAGEFELEDLDAPDKDDLELELED